MRILGLFSPGAAGGVGEAGGIQYKKARGRQASSAGKLFPKMGPESFLEPGEMFSAQSKFAPKCIFQGTKTSHECGSNSANSSSHKKNLIFSPLKSKEFVSVHSQGNVLTFHFETVPCSEM